MCIRDRFFTISYSLEDNKASLYNKDLAIEQFEQKYENSWYYRWNNYGTPHRIIGSKIPYVFYTQNEKISDEYARKFIKENQYLFGVDNSNLELWVNEFGNKIRYVTFNQTHNGIPVHNARIDFRFNAVGNIVLFGHDAYPDINVSTDYNLDDQRALDIAKKETQFSKDKGDYVFDVPKKYIWVSKDKKPAYHASWLLELHVHIKEVNTGKRPVNHWKVFVDAQSGDCLLYTSPSPRDS